MSRGLRTRPAIRRVVVVKSRFRAAYLVVFGLLCLAAGYAMFRPETGFHLETVFHLVAHPSAEEPPRVASMAGGSTSLYAPAVIPEDKGGLEAFRQVRMEVEPAMQVQSLIEPNARVKLGQPANIRFAARDRASGLPESLANPSASVFHGSDPERRLPVVEVENGVYEVPFTPQGPGLFNVVLSAGGVPVGFQKLGVVGATGNPDGKVDIIDPLSIDPRDSRARTGGGRGRRR